MTPPTFMRAAFSAAVLGGLSLAAACNGGGGEAPPAAQTPAPAQNLKVLGPADAPVLVIEYSDFQ